MHAYIVFAIIIVMWMWNQSMKSKSKALKVIKNCEKCMNDAGWMPVQSCRLNNTAQTTIAPSPPQPPSHPSTLSGTIDECKAILRQMHRDFLYMKKELALTTSPMTLSSSSSVSTETNPVMPPARNARVLFNFIYNRFVRLLRFVYFNRSRGI